MTTIRIADEALSPRSGHHIDRADAASVATGADRSIYSLGRLHRSTTTLSEDGIVNIRSRQPTGLGRRLSGFKDLEDDDPGLRNPDDYKAKQTFTGRYLLWLAYQSVGVIYGDIGTSPLYVFSSTFSEAPTKQNLTGVLSLVLWSMSIMVTFKYVLIVLYADNEGEGGSFSTYSLLSRYLNITHRDPREATMVQMQRVKTGDLGKASRGFRRGLEKSKIAHAVLKVVGILAVTAVLADGVLTPAQSVLGAVQGIEVVSPTISKSTIIGVTDAILVLLFVIQPLGISRMTVAFSPIVIIWLLLNAGFGIFNIVKYDASVFRAFNPGLAFDYLVRNGHDGWRSLGGVLLSFTGVEALFADLGAFSRGAVRLSWLTFVYPCLLLAYIGQAAYISEHPDAYSNPFFNSVPSGWLIPSLIFAMLAAIVASQAIITATFQLLAQVMKLSYFPQLKIIHTSKTFHGQLFVPLANWLLMVGTILVASIYNNTTSLGNAYGVCVMLVTFFDTSMVALAAMFVWNFSPWLVFLPWLFFACHDSAYLSAALEKVPSGAWFTLSLAAILAIIFLVWRFGKEQQWAAEAQDRFPTSHFVTTAQDGSMHLTDRYHGIPLSTTRGMGIFFDKAGETTPTVFSEFAVKLTAVPEVMIFFHMRPLERPSIAAEDRYSVSRLAIPNCYRVVVRYGFNDSVITSDLGAIIYQQVRSFIEVTPPLPHKQVIQGVAPQPSEQTSVAGDAEDEKTPAPTPAHPDKIPETSLRATESDIAKLDEAFKHKVLYIVGKEQMKTKQGTNVLRRVLLWAFLWMRENTRGKIADLKLPFDSLVEVGFLKEI